MRSLRIGVSLVRSLLIPATIAWPVWAEADEVPRWGDVDTPIPSKDGAAQLAWEGAEPPFQAELKGPSGSARVVYEGRWPQAHISGLRDGAYEVRVRGHRGAAWTAWSAPRTVVVEHISMDVVLPLMALGALTFMATAFVVVRGARREGA